MSALPPEPLARAYALPWLLDLLEADGALAASARRELEVREPTLRARLRRHQGSAHDAEVSPAEVVASSGLATPAGEPLDEDRVAALVAAHVGLPYCKIDPLQLDGELVTRTLSRPFARRHVVLPLRQTEQALTVAVANPFDEEVADSLRRIVKKDVVRLLASKRDILRCITDVYGFRVSVASAAAAEADGGAAAAGERLHDLEQLVRLRSLGDVEGSDSHVVNAVEFLLRYALEQRASDVHLEPRREHARVRLRIDGVLHCVHSLPRRVYPAVVSRLKTLARLDIAERRRPQDGRIKTLLAGSSVEMRLSTLPTTFGEKLVLRLFDPQAMAASLAELGLGGGPRQLFERWARAPHGLVLITGPTGSGKTTTLYATLRQLADDAVNITTVEDPIEVVTDLFNQTACQPRLGLDFAGALRTILRQDPDVIMVGEIRDQKTAEMACQAALTGHLIFSTLHTNDGPTAVTRLLDLGVPAYMVSATLVGVVAQRLLRRICDGCRVPVPLTAAARAALGPAADGDASLPAWQGADAVTYEGRGCGRCRGTGYCGRIGAFELLDVAPGVREAILGGADSAALTRAARASGWRPLRAAGLELLAAGTTSLAEVARLLGPAGA